MAVVLSNHDDQPNYNSILFSPRSSLSSLSNSPFKNKKRRPSKLDIPMMPLGLGGSDSRVVESADVEEGVDGIYSVYCKKGRRMALEDRFSVNVDFNAQPKQAIFGVFDGHGGSKASEYASKNLTKNIITEISTNSLNNTIEDKIKNAYLKTDSNFLQQENNIRGGSCCVTALITNGNLIISNAGDCRAVISTNGVSIPLTSDHRPSRKDEKDRIQSNGGYIDCYNGVWRIQGSLAVSRGIGDGQLKEWVIAEPETRVLKIGRDDEFLILASDGLWEKVGNQEAVDVVRSTVGEGGCKKLVDLAVERGSFDDVTVMVIPLQKYMQ